MKKRIAVTSIASLALCEQRLVFDRKHKRKLSTDAAAVIKRGEKLHHRVERENRPWSRGGGGRDRRCFIATAVYGSPDLPEVMTLREFRDNVLKKSAIGNALVEAYYRVSPPVADFLEHRPKLAAVIRSILNVIVRSLNKKGGQQQ